MTHATRPSRNTISETVVSCLREEVPAIPIGVEHDTDLAAYGLNSMKLVEIMFGLEDAFGITIDEDEIFEETFSSVGTIVNFLAEEKNVTQ